MHGEVPRANAPGYTLLGLSLDGQVWPAHSSQMATVCTQPLAGFFTTRRKTRTKKKKKKKRKKNTKKIGQKIPFLHSLPRFSSPQLSSFLYPMLHFLPPYFFSSFFLPLGSFPLTLFLFPLSLLCRLPLYSSILLSPRSFIFNGSLISFPLSFHHS